MLTIDARVAGRARPLLSCWEMSMPSWIDGRYGPPTLRALISRIVAADIDACNEHGDGRHLLYVLTKMDVADHPDGVGIDLDEVVHHGCYAVEAIAKALRAFEEGKYEVLIDGHEERDLDTKLFLGPDTQVTFLRRALVARA